MFVFMNRQDVYWVSDGFSREYFESDNDWLNACDATFGTIALALSPSLRYLSKSIEYSKDLWTKLDRTFGKIDEDHNRNLNRKYSTIRVLDQKLLASTLSSECFQDEKEAKSSSNDFPFNSVQNLPVIASESEEKI